MTIITWIVIIGIILLIAGFITLRILKNNIIIANSWMWSKWQKDNNITTTYCLSYCGSEKYHCASDALAAVDTNEYNSKSTLVYYSTDKGRTFVADVFYMPNLILYGITNDGVTMAGISQDLKPKDGTDGCGLWFIQYAPYTLSSTILIPTNGKYDSSMNIVNGEQYTTHVPDTSMNMPYSLAMSPDGTYMCLVGNNNDTIWYSHDTGHTWYGSNGAPKGSWLKVLMSTDTLNGIPLCTTAFFSGNRNGSIKPNAYRSNDGGQNWYATTLSGLLTDTTSNTNISNNNGNNDYNYSDSHMQFVSACMSSTGQYQYAIINIALYVSCDYGHKWDINPIPTTDKYDNDITDWCSISCSSDGKTILLASEDDGVFQSTDYGKTWTFLQTVIEATGGDAPQLNPPYDLTFFTSVYMFPGGKCVTTCQEFYYERDDISPWWNYAETLVIGASILLSLFYIYFTYKTLNTSDSKELNTTKSDTMILPVNVMLINKELTESNTISESNKEIKN